MVFEGICISQTTADRAKVYFEDPTSYFCRFFLLTAIFDFNKVGVSILWVFVMTYIYFYQIDTTFNLTVKMGHSDT